MRRRAAAGQQPQRFLSDDGRPDIGKVDLRVPGDRNGTLGRAARRGLQRLEVRFQPQSGGAALSDNVSPTENAAFELRMSHATRICPQCHGDIGSAGYGSGALTDGLFCSLGCFSDYWYGSDDRFTAR
jgi:hypothetical protein